jgi:hypothetical protein
MLAEEGDMSYEDGLSKLAQYDTTESVVQEHFPGAKERCVIILLIYIRRGGYLDVR